MSNSLRIQFHLHFFPPAFVHSLLWIKQPPQNVTVSAHGSPFGPVHAHTLLIAIYINFLSQSSWLMSYYSSTLTSLTCYLIHCNHTHKAYHIINSECYCSDLTVLSCALTQWLPSALGRCYIIHIIHGVCSAWVQGSVCVGMYACMYCIYMIMCLSGIC